MKSELQEVMGMLRKLQGSIDFGNAPADEREELATDVADIMDELFEIMKRLPDEEGAALGNLSLALVAKRRKASQSVAVSCAVPFVTEFLLIHTNLVIARCYG